MDQVCRPDSLKSLDHLSADSQSSSSGELKAKNVNTWIPVVDLVEI